MVDIDLRLPELNSMRRRYARAPALVGPILRRCVEDALDIQVETTRALIPLGRPTAESRPHLRDTVSGSVAGGGGLIRGVLRVTGRHARYVDEGTRPHEILPRRAKVLAFGVGGRTVFARRVRHPGTRPVRFMARGADQARSGQQAVFRRGLAQIVDALRRR